MSPDLFKRFTSQFESRYARNIGLLAGTAGLSHIITILGYPLLTRIYTPQDFGILAQFLVLMSILQIIAALRFEIAIPLAENNETAENITALSLICTIITSLLVAMTVLTAGPLLAEKLRVQELLPYLWLLPFGMLGGGFFQVFNYWAIREKYFTLIAQAKIVQAVTAVAIQLTSSVFMAGPLGLVLGVIAGQSAGGGRIARQGGIRSILAGWKSRHSLWQTAKEHRRTALASSCSGLINTFGLQLPYLLMASFYGVKAGGFFLLANKIFSAANELLGTAVAQTYYGEAAARYREDRRLFRKLFFKTTGLLFLVGLLFTILVLTIAPWLIDIAFGREWHEVGLYAQYLTILFLANIVCSPLSTTIFILKKQHIQVIWDIFRVAAVGGAFYLSTSMGWDASKAVLAFSISAGIALWILYLINLILVLREK